MGGGRGTRMGPLAERHGCKSLVPIGGAPALEWVLGALAFAFLGNARIILCIERPELLSPMQQLCARIGGNEVEIYCNPLLKGTMHALYLLRDTLQEERVVVLYGHQPLYPQHLIQMMRRKRSNAVVSLYPTSSNVSRKIGVVSKRGEILKLLQGGSENGLGEGDYYLDVPYLLPADFIQAQQDEYVRSHDAIARWAQAGNAVQGQIANFPHEFHYPEEIGVVGEFAQTLRRTLAV